MKLPFLEHPRIINTLLTLGAAVLGVLLIVGIGVPLFLYYQTKSQAPQPTNDIPAASSGVLGGGGARCSGPERFPCMPGTICNVADADWGVKYGTCEPDSKSKQPFMPSR